MAEDSNYSEPYDSDTSLQILDEKFAEIAKDDAYSELKESWEEVRNQLRFEDRHWDKWWGSAWGVNQDVLGLELEELKELSLEIRSQVTGQSLLKNGVELRSGYIWSKGVTFPGTEKPKGAGSPSKLRKFYVQPRNQEALLSSTAFFEMEKSAYSDGNFYILGKDSDKTVQRIALTSVCEIYTNPQFLEEVWAYRIELPNLNPNNPEPDVKWVYTDRFDGPKKSSIKTNDKSYDVMTGYTIFDARFNRQVGHPLGVPDALPAVAWARAHSEGMKGGLQMQKALAYLAFTITNKSPAGAANAAAKVPRGRGSGNTATMVAGQDMNPLSTAGKGYDFSSLIGVAGMAAAALQVSVVSLLASPGASGSSYGAAATLDQPQRNAMRQRQSSWGDFFRRIFYWVTKDIVDICFPPIDDIDFYRLSQGVALAWNTGAIWADEIRPELLKVLGIIPKHDSAPAGIMIPNNSNSAARIDVDPNGAAYSGPDSNKTSTGTQAASPDQGVATGAGQSGANDMRSDILSQSLNAMNLDRLEELVERLERAGRVS